MQPEETPITGVTETLVAKSDNDAILDAIKELTKVIGELKTEMKDLKETSAKWFRAQRGF